MGVTVGLKTSMIDNIVD